MGGAGNARSQRTEMNRAGGGRGAAVDEIQGTRGVDGWGAGNPRSQPEAEGPKKSVAGR